jgi:4-amino-4-deoxy-L-arabinose transferase-like glycosyltransferase
MATDAKKTFLITLFFISLITHVLFFYYFFYINPCRLSFDSAHYHQAALSLKNGLGFSTADGSPYFYRLPGYPVFLASIYALFGTSPYYVIGVQILLASLLPVLIFFLAKKLFIYTRSTPPAHPAVSRRSFMRRRKPVEGLERTGAKLACLITSFHPAFFIFPCLIMSEMLFVFLFTLFLIMFIHGLESHFQPTWPFFSGLLLGIISLIRPLGPQLVIICIFLTVLYPGLSIFCRFLKSFMLFFGWGLVVSLWLLRNFLLTGSLFFHTFSGPHLLNHGATRIIMETQNISYERAKELVQKDLEMIEKAPEITRSRLQEKYALSVMMRYPSTTIPFFIKNMIKTSISLYASELLFVDSGGKLPPYDTKRSIRDMINRFVFPEVTNKAIPYVIYYELIFMLFLFVGFALFLAQCVASFVPIRFRFATLRANGVVRVWPPILMLSFIALFIGMSCVCGFARLRLPIEPMLIIGSAYFYSRTASKFPDS